LSTDPIRADRRREGRVRHQVLVAAACADCGETDAVVLDFDHDVGRPIDAEAGTVRCANCHRRVTTRRMGAGVQLRPVPLNVLEREVIVLRSLAVSLEANAAGLRRRADEMEKAIFALDAAGYEWRSLPGMQL
jgi:hypothetical protein